ncbi:uncharacterized protein PAN0_005c2502 [Moesziomyces antarcticus]|uniref:Uncharacterized protein n=1 Tax=Pseudozyma antarctica TaxID=84753 RepID=A0A081CC94_PSEA2|nr:uncharacterized protein PAN0_005c2502 [Moesziomyces antarcticus]GAK64290.1 hypothetical protein PAN0_005c2502 [Moesziomyces antarcticus]
MIYDPTLRSRPNRNCAEYDDDDDADQLHHPPHSHPHPASHKAVQPRIRQTWSLPTQQCVDYAVATFETPASTELQCALRLTVPLEGTISTAIEGVAARILDHGFFS